MRTVILFSIWIALTVFDEVTTNGTGMSLIAAGLLGGFVGHLIAMYPER